MKHSLEVQLMEKNKSLENNYTQLKVRFSQLEETSTQDQITLTTLQQKVQKQQDLVQRLEEDLLYRVGNPTSTTATTTTATNDHRPSTDLPRSSTSSSLTGLGLELSHHQQTALSPSNSSFDLSQQQQQETQKEDKTILPIVIQQRDRFRQRNAELEQKSRGLERQLDDVRADMDRLQQDNLNLYERLKFVHVWKEEQQQRGATVSLPPPSPLKQHPLILSLSLSILQNRSTSIQMADLSSDGVAEDKYGKLYEENMNPFAQFHRKEEKRRYNALNPADKLTLKMTRLMFSHRWSRYFLIAYALLLHLLVVTTLYQLSLWECRHDHEEFNLPPQIIAPP